METFTALFTRSSCHRTYGDVRLDFPLLHVNKPRVDPAVRLQGCRNPNRGDR